MKVSREHTSTQDQKCTEVLFPFSIHIDPMERLLLVNFENDPDSIYVGFEPQVFNDEINGAGHLVIGWRKDKKVDVYHEKSLNPDPSKYSIAGAGLHKIVPAVMEKAFFEVREHGVRAHYKFTDIKGRDVEFWIEESNPKKRKPFGLLAPMGDAALHPTSLPLVLLHDFYFVRKKKTDIALTIDNRSHKLDDLPMPIDRQKMTFARYSPNPMIATLNPATDGKIESFKAEIGQTIIHHGDTEYELEWEGNSPSVKSMRVKDKNQSLTITFSPSFPSADRIESHQKKSGGFVLSGDESVGTLSGEYSIQSADDSVVIKVIPSGGWRPKTTKFSTWFLFTVAKIFKQWPTTYQWDAHLHQSEDGVWQMQSAWKRIGKIQQE